jgi:hypothetical protein
VDLADGRVAREDGALNTRVVIALWLLIVFVALVVLVGWAGQSPHPGREKTQVYSGVAPVGSYLSQPFSPGAGKTWLGMEATRDELDPASEVELVGELSFDGGQTWPPDCLPAPATVCHDHTQTMPPQTQYFMVKTRGDAVNREPLWGEYLLAEVTDQQTRFRGRLIVRGSPSRGTVYLTWR